MATERIIGVDFGTSTSVIRVKRYQDGRPVGDPLEVKQITFGKGNSISCKMPRPLKANLYEVYCLANRFSMNSQAAMVYVFDSSINKEDNEGEDWRVVWARARKMNVEVANMLDAKYGLAAMMKRMMDKVGR